MTMQTLSKTHQSPVLALKLSLLVAPRLKAIVSQSAQYSFRLQKVD